MEPAVTVVVVSDYKSGEEHSWNDIRELLRALARQDFAEPFEVILCETEAFADRIPSDLAAILPNLRIVVSSETGSFELKTAGVEAAVAEFVAICDGDCTPAEGWMSSLVAGLRANPRAAVVSGRTRYDGNGFAERALGLIARSHVDCGGRGHTQYVANNNCAYRREVYLEHPLPADLGPFSTRIQSEAILRDGWELIFEPGMLAFHTFDGWKMEADGRRNAGFGCIATRLRDRSQPYAWLTRLGYISVPFFALGRAIDATGDCLRCARHYGIRPFELPVTLALAFLLRSYEIPGMLRAFRGRTIEQTAYR